MIEVILAHPFLSFFTIWILASCITRMWEASFSRPCCADEKEPDEKEPEE